MKRFVLLSGWTTAAITVALAIAMNLQVQRLSEEFDEMHLSSAEMTLRIRELSENIETMESANEELAGRADEAEQAVEAEAAEEPPPPETAEAPTEEKNPQSAYRMSDETLGSIVRIQVNSEYGEFLDGLKLSGERASEVRAILYEVLGETIRYWDAKPDERAPFEVPAGMAPDQYYANRLRLDLVQVLSIDEIEYFDEYKAEQPTRTIRGIYERLLIQSAAGLTAENRTIVLDVFMDEFRIGIEEFRIAVEALEKLVLGRDIEEILHRQLDTFYRSVERLADVLDADQMAVMQRFIEVQEMRQSLDPQ